MIPLSLLNFQVFILAFAFRRFMEQEGLNLLQQAFKGFLKCLGLESGGGENVANDGETVNITDPAAQPLHQEASRSSDPEPSSYDTPIIDPLVEVLSSPVSNIH
ncbi:hypothetical protein Tco_0994700 [Tanacetum coccineum]